MTMSRSPIVLILLLIASSLVVDAQQKRYFEDFRGQSFCAKRQGSREGQCCSSRYDECSVPIAGNNSTLPRTPSLTIWHCFQVHCVIVMSFATNISTLIAVPTMRRSVKESATLSSRNVKSVPEFSSRDTRRKKSTAIYGENLTAKLEACH